MAKDHSKSMFAQNFKGLYPPHPWLCFRPCYFYVYPLSQCTFILLSYDPSQKKFCNAYEFLNEKSGSENREKLIKFFVESKDKRLFFIQSCMQQQ